MADRVNMRLLDIDKRKGTFEEVTLGYSLTEAITEASRCLNCKNPKCVEGCPVNVDIPRFISLIKNNEIDQAYKVITEQNSFPGVCGRVCPQEKQCEGRCIKGIKGEAIAIGRLERFASDNVKNIEIKKVENNNKSIGIVGSGPAGLACASECLNLGFNVTIYEALHIAGGVLSYGIPNFRLPKTIVNSEIKRICERGAILKTNYVVGKTIDLEDLLKLHDYVFVGVGAGLPRFMNIPGENYNGVMSANEFLTRVNLMKGYLNESDTPLKSFKNVVVVGGGNVAMDASRCAKRIGASVHLVYRRSKEEMPARKEEIEHAIEEGIEFKTLHNPIRINGDNDYNITSVDLQVMELGEIDSSGRRSFVAVDGVTVNIKCDCLIMAIGNYSNPILKNSTNLIAFDKKGLIITDESLQTTNELIYAGGDIVTGAATVISAMGAGKKAALSIAKINNKDK